MCGLKLFQIEFFVVLITIFEQCRTANVPEGFDHDDGLWF